MQTLLCFTLVLLSTALSARGGVPDSLKSYFFPAGAPAVANSEYPNSQHNDQTQRKPGRCIRLGGHTPACQTSDYVSINFNECS
ncbi:unnamed protein product [Larinioides sclopetarius]|uniref:Uncharacterized protein n=1 Tax=Larinioides sclopetarius TaxID=280406 RepID=A0AAV2BBW0_9ARAC